MVLFAGGAAACDSNADKAENRTGSTTVDNGDQRGSGSDGSVVENPPGNTPGGNDVGDEPTGDNSGQDKP